MQMDISTVVFALVAIFVVLKLRSVLGTRSGPTRPPVDPALPRAPSDLRTRPPAARSSRSASPAERARGRTSRRRSDRWKGFAAPGSAVAAGFDAIAAVDRGFAPDSFLSGARAAYEMIVGAFAAGDLSTLRRLLAPEVLANFDKAIRTRRRRRADDDDDAGVDRRRRRRRGAAGRHGRLGRRALRRQAGFGDARHVGRGGRGIGQRGRRPSRRVDVHPRRRARATPIGCWRRRRRCTEAGAARREGGRGLEAAARDPPWRRASQPVRFDDLAGFAADDALAAFAAFRRWARALRRGAAPMRAARAPSPRLVAIAREAVAARRSPTPPTRVAFSPTRFRAFRVVPDAADGKGLLTGYYEPRHQGFADADGRISPRRSWRGRAISSPSRPATRRPDLDPALDRRAAPRRRDAAALSRPRGDRGRGRRGAALARRSGRGLLRPGAGLGARRTRRRAQGAPRL